METLRHKGVKFAVGVYGGIEAAISVQALNFLFSARNTCQILVGLNMSGFNSNFRSTHLQSTVLAALREKEVIGDPTYLKGV